MNRRLPPAMAYENVAARLKWYNPTKGFGFVRPPDVDKDAFLHASVIAESGMSSLPVRNFSLSLLYGGSWRANA